MASQLVPQPTLTEECLKCPGNLILFTNTKTDADGNETKTSYCEQCLVQLEKKNKEEDKKEQAATEKQNNTVLDLIARLQAPASEEEAKPEMTTEEQVGDL